MKHITYSKDRKLKIIVCSSNIGFCIDVCCLQEDNTIAFWREVSINDELEVLKCILSCITKLKSHKRFIYNKAIPFPKS